MPITRSHAPEIERLMSTLVSGPAVEREAATARLRVLGARAVDHLLAALTTLSPSQQVGIVTVLEDIADTRIVPAVLPLVADAETSLAAIAVVRAHWRDIAAPRRAAVRAALEAAAIDTTLPLDARGLAVAVLSEMSSSGGRRETPPTAPSEPSHQPAPAGDELASVLANAVAGWLPASPDLLRSALARHGTTCSAAELQDVVAAVAAEERRAAAQLALEWSGVRAAAHQLLATQHSRLGVADLRETVERWHDRLPVGFIVALAEIGDAESLESLAIAHERAESEWVREQIVSACRQVVRRHHLTRRHAAFKRAVNRAAHLASRL